jgi:hypothetical protein
MAAEIGSPLVAPLQRQAVREFIVRSITIFCSCVLALALLAAPAKAESTNNTVFAVFDFGGFSFDGTGEDMYESESTSNLFIINLAAIEGDFLDFLGLTFNELDLNDVDLSDLSYFILGEIDGSEHLILSANEDGEPIDAMFEEDVLAGVTDMGGLASPLGAPGGTAFVSPEDFANHFGNGIGIDTFVSGTGDIPFGTVASEGGGSVDMLGFTDPTLLGRISLTFVNGNLVGNFSVPEPGFAVLAIVGIAGAVMARRRRRAAK